MALEISRSSMKPPVLKRGSTLVVLDQVDAVPFILPWARALSLNANYPSVDLTDEQVLFGRKEPCQVIIDNPAISGIHCRIYRSHKAVTPPAEPDSPQTSTSPQTSSSTSSSRSASPAVDISTSVTAQVTPSSMSPNSSSPQQAVRSIASHGAFSPSSILHVSSPHSKKVQHQHAAHRAPRPHHPSSISSNSSSHSSASSCASAALASLLSARPPTPERSRTPSAAAPLPAAVPSYSAAAQGAFLAKRKKKSPHKHRRDDVAEKLKRETNIETLRTPIPKPAIFLEDLSTNGTFIGSQKIGNGNKVKITSGTEFTLLNRGPQRERISYVLLVHGESPIDAMEKAPEGELTLVFTDIQKSTTLWEAAPTAMNEALEKHDIAFRTLLSRYRGYEVKTEGDAFMVAFFNVLDAVRWCMAVQQALLRIQWPPELLKQPAAAVERDEHGRLLWAGFRVRMGIHTGEPNCRRNPVTGRMDYFGGVVNVAARVSAAAHGGQVVCTQPVIDVLLSNHSGCETLSSLSSPSSTFVTPREGDDEDDVDDSMDYLHINNKQESEDDDEDGIQRISTSSETRSRDASYEQQQQQQHPSRQAWSDQQPSLTISDSTPSLPTFSPSNTPLVSTSSHITSPPASTSTIHAAMLRDHMAQQHNNGIPQRPIITTSSQLSLSPPQYVRVHADGDEPHIPIEIHDLGPVPLKGLSEPVQMYQLSIRELRRRQFPVLRNIKTKKAAAASPTGVASVGQVAPLNLVGIATSSTPSPPLNPTSPPPIHISSIKTNPLPASNLTMEPRSKRSGTAILNAEEMNKVVASLGITRPAPATSH